MDGKGSCSAPRMRTHNIEAGLYRELLLHYASPLLISFHQSRSTQKASAIRPAKQPDPFHKRSIDMERFGPNDTPLEDGWIPGSQIHLQTVACPWCQKCLKFDSFQTRHMDVCVGARQGLKDLDARQKALTLGFDMKGDFSDRRRSWYKKTVFASVSSQQPPAAAAASRTTAGHSSWRPIAPGPRQNPVNVQHRFVNQTQATFQQNGQSGQYQEPRRNPVPPGAPNAGTSGSGRGYNRGGQYGQPGHAPRPVLASPAQARVTTPVQGNRWLPADLPLPSLPPHLPQPLSLRRWQQQQQQQQQQPQQQQYGPGAAAGSNAGYSGYGRGYNNANNQGGQYGQGGYQH